MWIKCEWAMPKLTTREIQINEEKDDGEFGDWNLYFSDEVVVLYEDGYIGTARWEMFDYRDITKENYFMSDNCDCEKHGEVIAWRPFEVSLPRWFMEDTNE